MEPDGELRYLQLVKSNLASTQIPTMTFTIEETEVLGATGEPIMTSKLSWGRDTTTTIHDLLKNQQGFFSYPQHPALRGLSLAEDLPRGARWRGGLSRDQDRCCGRGFRGGTSAASPAAAAAQV